MLKFKKMGTDKVSLLLITANVGSMFENPSVMLPIWTSEFLQAVSRMDPKFIALHLQEVGGKTYEKSMQYVQDFVQRLCDCPELRLYDKIRVFLDEDYSSPENFTALGNMYFAHTSLTDLKIWDFDLKTYVEVVGKETHTGNIEKITTKEKAKFPQNFFPECKWSRKGYLRTRWCIRGTAVEFINIHLFHDASNLVALDAFPSVYSRSRRRALRHTLRQLLSDSNAAPYFLFGDFNFRPDTEGAVKKLTENLISNRLHNGQNIDSSKLQYRNQEDRVVLTIGKKEFVHIEHQKIFREPWLLKFDREMEALRPHLYEFPIKFPPTYPFEEDTQLPTHYMKTRCPAWCDRILLSQSARLLLHQDSMRSAENKHLHASRKSVAESTDSSGSGRMSSSDSSPVRTGSPARQGQNPTKNLEKKTSVADFDALSVPGINVARKSIADPTSVQQAMSSRQEPGSPARRKLVRNQSEGSPKLGDAVSPELRRLVDAPARKRVEYGILGETACMGDHKPVYLRAVLQSERGTICCCGNSDLCAFSDTLHRPRLVTDPDLYAALRRRHLSNIHPDSSSDSELNLLRTDSLTDLVFPIPDVEITKADLIEDDIFVNDVDTNLLDPRRCMDPYTPESIDSHTPNVEGASTSDLSMETIDIESTELNARSKNKSISPMQLKSRLDMLIDESKKSKVLTRLNSRDSDMSVGGFCCVALKCYRFCRKRLHVASRCCRRV